MMPSKVSLCSQESQLWVPKNPVTKSLSFQHLFRFLEHYFKFSQRQSKRKRKENLIKIKMASIVSACNSRHQTENTWAWKEKTARSKIFLASCYYMFSTSLNLPNSPLQFSGRIQDTLVEKYCHVPVQHHSWVLPVTFSSQLCHERNRTACHLSQGRA